jgi:hypothetical protein
MDTFLDAKAFKKSSLPSSTIYSQSKLLRKPREIKTSRAIHALIKDGIFFLPRVYNRVKNDPTY